MCSSLRIAGSHLFSIRVGQLALVRRWQGLGQREVVRGGGWSDQMDLSGDKRSQAADSTQVPAPGRESSLQSSRAATGSRGCSP